jgi:glycosyltransferase involved in cell wall biosynthesis
MKVSIVIPVLNSHEIVRRQVLHFEKIGIPDDVEIIIVDDGSTPPIEIQSSLPIILHKTNDFREWTWAVARNTGAKLAKGEYFIMADLDHIITREFIDIVRNFTGDHVRINREFAVLDEDGNFTQDRDILEAYGLPKDKPLQFNPHRNQFAIHKDLYWKLGGYREDRIGKPYPQREDGDFAKKWRLAYEAGEIKDYDDLVGYEKRPILYMFPNGKYCGDVDFNPKGLFHTLTRKTPVNRFHHE